MRPLSKWCFALGVVLLLVAMGLGFNASTHRQALVVAPITTVVLIVGLVTYQMDRASHDGPWQ